MKISSIMNPNVETARAEDDLAKTAMVMWRKDCGFVPVVDEASGRVVGVITDRDICMATATRHDAPETISVRDTMASHVWMCRTEDEVDSALETMRANQVHRLPVIDGGDRLAGIISFSDIVRHATQDGKIRSIGDHDLITAYRAIKAPRIGTESDGVYDETRRA
jgi:CBS domain-containing protein